jgi:hypothetical protein
LAVVAGAAAVLSFATVRDLAQSSGYPPNLAWLLPVVIDATAVVGSRIWLGGGGHPGAVRYARTLALAAAAVTIGANVLQHGLVAHHLSPPWWLVAVLAAIPPTALVAVAHQVALLARAVHPAVSGDGAEALEGAKHRPSPPRREPAPSTTRPGAGIAGGDLAARARQLITASPEPIGRRRLARELEISEHQARRLLTHVTRAPGDTAPASPAATHTPALNGASHV